MITLCVRLWAAAGHQDELSAYEDGVLSLLVEHGGQVVARVRCPSGQTPDSPDEVQILDLPDEDALARFLADPRRLAAAELRRRAVTRTEVVRGAHLR